jgi:putative membrane protein
MVEYLVHWLVASVVVVVTAYVVPGIKINNFVSAMVAALVIGIVNVAVWPLLVFLTLPLTVITFGLFLFVVNGLALKISAALTPGFTIDGFLPAILGSLVLSIVGSLVRFVFFSQQAY